MNKKFKGFTLVELIVVMALIAILMPAIVQLFKPIRDTYVDSTQYEAKRTTQNGIIQYITESVRYARDMGIYNDKTNAQAAVTAFAAKYCTDYNIDSTKTTAVTNEISKNAQVIIIDNKTSHTYHGNTFTGRVVRRKIDAAAIGADPVWANNQIAASSKSKWRMALGEAYYGENTYNITLDTSDKTDGMLGVSVVSTNNSKRDISKKGTETNVSSLNVTRGSVLCRNLTSTTLGNAKLGVTNAGIYDTSLTATTTANIYIVFLDSDGKDKVKAVS